MHPLVQYRTANSITQAALADLISVDQSVLSRFERGLARPKWETAQRIERVTEGDVTAVALMDHTERAAS